MIGLLLGILITIGGIGVYLLVYRLVAPPKKEEGGITDLVVDKAKDMSSFTKLDPEKSILDKLDLFIVKNLGLESRLEQTHMLLGNPEKPTPLQMLHQKELAALLVVLLLFFLTGNYYAILAAPLGFILPDLGFNSTIRKRQDSILRGFPTMVDLAALIIESGLDYMTAFDRIVKVAPVKSALEEELEKTLSEVQLGYNRRDALQRLAARTGIQEVRSFVSLIIQSDELGTSLVDLLRNFSGDMRFRRLNRAERLAAQASTKMLIPLFVFIFPTVFILVLAPMIADLLRGGSFF